MKSYFDTLLRYVLSVTFCGAVVLRVWEFLGISDYFCKLLACKNSRFSSLFVACVAGAKRGGGREKGKKEGSACSKSLCFCITPTNFLVIRLRLLSIKCRYTRHCRKTLHSRTKEIRLVIQIQMALWRKLEPFFFSRNKKSFTLQKRSKKLRLHQRANPADQKTITTVNR